MPGDAQIRREETDERRASHIEGRKHDGAAPAELLNEGLVRFLVVEHDIAVVLKPANDVDDLLLRLLDGRKPHRPIAFRPSHSGAALLGLDPCQRRAHCTPDASEAAHWVWEVTGEFAVLTLED